MAKKVIKKSPEKPNALKKKFQKGKLKQTKTLTKHSKILLKKY